MARNYDTIIGDAHLFAGILREDASQGRFPKHMISKFVTGGEVFVQITNFLLSQGGKGAIYIARDKHKKIYGVSLILLRKPDIVKQKQLLAPEAIQERGGIDQFCVRLWSRNSAGGLYRRAKTKYRTRANKATALTPSVVIDRIDSDTGLPMNPDFVSEDDENEATLGTVNF